MKRQVLAMFVTCLMSIVVHAADKPHARGNPPVPATQSALADGEIRKVDKAGKKLTIRHGPLTALNMPAMTMAFQVKDPAMLEQVKPGDKVKFEAEKVGGGYVVTRIQAAE